MKSSDRKSCPRASCRPSRTSRSSGAISSRRCVSVLACRAVGREGVRRRNGDEDQHRDAGRVSSFRAAKIWGLSRRWASPRTSAFSTVWRNTRDTAWTAHGRYPTNTPGWWGGAHPFALLDYSIVHNGEISSYDANRRFIEMFGYKCNLQTDTEVITYIIDYLMRDTGA